MENSLTTYLLLGSNIGDREFYLKNAIDLLAKHFKVLQVSSIYETAAWGDRVQNAYLNMAIQLEVDVSPAELHKITRATENKLGRIDKGNFLPRTIDIDIIFFGQEIIQSQKLTIPHPRLQGRRFVLTPLNEIAASFEHPILKKNIKKLLESCPDNLPVTLFKASKNIDSEV